MLDTLTSTHSQRSYRTGLERFFAWIRTERDGGREVGFSKALAGRYRAELLVRGLSASTINLRLSPIRKLAREMADNGLLDPVVAAAIERVSGVEARGHRTGNWLTRDQANDLLNAPDPQSLAGKRDRAILALLIGCGLRRAELLRIDLEHLEQREGRWVLPDMVGKGNRLRTVTIPAGVKARIDLWIKAAGITEGRLLRPVTQAGVVGGEEIRDERTIWRLVVRYARETELGKLAPHDLRRTCASSAAKLVVSSNRSSCYLVMLPSRPPNAISVPNRISPMPSMTPSDSSSDEASSNELSYSAAALLSLQQLNTAVE